ncbi:MAG: hypothetical protein CL477_05600 [Acidobacteria bacterium]|jgi:mono/diheme cytochrome c family protein|nr:hypothetical protein [Acidobacteriota bacterium]MDP7338337.1 c-type cytochrome [Vicinamibacterales bacterium]MDP7692205.1 c-type cytochrome [Vicinamibacterales bacterium]HJN46587.1 c-type cytochrome [Vicinamibacterales bacterium]
MIRTVGSVLFGLMVLAAGASLSRAEQPQENPFAGDAEAVAEGRALLDAVCGGYCHAMTEGGNTDAPDLFDCEWWHGDTDADLFRVIQSGVPDTRMLSFGGQFPDEDLWRIIAAIRADSRCREDADQPR